MTTQERKIQYSLTEVCGETVHVAPCRCCGGKPIFRWVDVPYYMINLYVISCPTCGIEYLQEWNTDKIEKAWNDNDIPFEEWAKDRYFFLIIWRFIFMTSEELLKNIMFRCPFCGHMQETNDIKDHHVGNNRTVKDVIETMDTDQRTVMYYLIGKAVEETRKKLYFYWS